MNDAFDEEMRAVVRNLPSSRPDGLPPAPTIKGNGRHEPVYDFEDLGAKIAEGMVQAAEEQLLAAQNALEQTKAFAENVRAKVQAKAAELSDMNNRLKVLGSSIVTAHKVFCGEDDHKVS